MKGALLVCGTHSDAGKSLITAGLCRWLKRRGVSVAPFKAQNMALNSVVARGGFEIGRAQAMQAAAAGVEAEVAMNPILIKPSGDRHSQVIVMGRPYADVGARTYQGLKDELRPIVADALADLRVRFDVVVCEGAGSPAEINLRAADLTNMGLARAADLPVLLVGDIDRGGVFASLLGTVAALSAEDQRHIAGYVINKFRGDASILAPGLDQITALTGRPVYGVLPFAENLTIDAEDSLAIEAPRADVEGDGGTLDVAVVRLRWMSNFTDLDALAREPGVRVRFTRSAVDIARADLVVVPGTKATVADLQRLRAEGLDVALQRRAAAGDPILGVCGGYQLLGTSISDDVESGAGEVEGLGVLPVRTPFAPDKVLATVTGHSPLLRSDVGGYEIRHGRPARTDPEAAPLIVTSGGDGEGCVVGATLGTSWHGLLEHDDARRALLRWTAATRRIDFVPATISFHAERERQLDRLGDLVEEHLDTDALLTLIERGAPPDLPDLLLERAAPC
ncbi:cobyric acid synthase [Paraconexibacter antarcticus]|uniref:Cobyric acid synthase n=1 Tax=Paraconexibacter antarcticus TaxID=2949664 RepID=A0ABY5DT30_9ACTN|nr:cobyric acid synthase [Paraconexibacter antarcticus]UTI64126.1 cobyric acid synthase [Paraconexibacter antarcticus]